MLDIRVLKVGEYLVNCYLLVAPGDKQAVLIDPGDEAGKILEWISPLQIHRIFITHGHPDHVGALETVRKALDCPVGIHAADAEHFNLSVDFHVRDGENFVFGGEKLEIVHIPGHTPGSIALCMIEGERMGRAMVGDAIFPGGPGHTESPTALRQLLDSLARTVFTWRDETMLYPGHGDPTSVGAERAAFAAFRMRPQSSDLCGDVTWR
jgi:glyoxylase-like metal-dependent hydrolase (beta-lactamase superfamily II)